MGAFGITANTFWLWSHRLYEAALDLECTQPKAALQQEANRLALESSASELKQVKATLTEFGAHERDAKALSTQVGEFEQSREMELRENCELNTQLKMVEQARDALSRERSKCDTSCRARGSYRGGAQGGD